MKNFASVTLQFYSNKCESMLPTAVLLLPILISTPACAEAFFNPAFLSDDTAGVADLSRFEKGHQQPPGVYRFDIWRNNEFIGSRDVRFLEAESNRQEGALSGGLNACINADWLAELGVNLEAYPQVSHYEPDSCLPVATIIPGAEIRINFSTLRLDISLPQAAMNNSARGYISPDKWDNGISALMSNYQFSGNHGSSSSSYYLNLQNGGNWGPWRLRNNSAWYYQSADSQRYSRWQNINTYAQRAIIKLKSTLIVGQNTTSGDIFDSAGYAGVRLYSSEMMYPDSQQGYAPTVRGIAQTAAKVVIRQNGYVIYQQYVTPGAFAIDDLTPASTNGNLDVSVEETDGRVQRYTVPYATVPLLQREGRVKYDVVVGRFRSGTPDKSSPQFGQATLLAGLKRGYTLYSGLQIAPRYRALSAGLGKNMGSFGAVSFDLTAAQSQLADDSRHQGQSLRFLYAKSLPELGTNFQLLGYRYSTRGFYTLSDVAWKSIEGYRYGNDQSLTNTGLNTEYHNLKLSKKGRFQASISQPMGDYGSLYLSASQQSYWGSGQKDNSVQLGYASSWRDMSYSLSWSQSQTLGLESKDRIMALNLSIPFTVFQSRHSRGDRWLQRAWSTTSYSHSKESGDGWQTGIGGTLLEEGNLSYNLTQGQRQNAGGGSNLSATWRNRYTQLGVGYSASAGRQDFNGQVSGGLLVHSDGVTFSQPLGETNVLIKAPGAAGVGIQNQTGIKTDWRGYTVVPYATTYRNNRIALDSNSLDEHTDIEKSVSNVIPTEGAIVRADFKTRIGVRAMFTIMQDDKPVPFGAMVRELNTGLTGMVADEGQTFLSGLPLQGVLLIQWGSNGHQRCTAPYKLTSESLQHTFNVVTTTCIAPTK